MKQAVIDLGTNTFHLMIEERNGTDTPTVLFRESRAAKLGKAGINQGVITEAAIVRALTVLWYFGEQLARFGIDPERVITIGTSAIRVAGNQAEFVARVRQETGLQIRVISGDEEAGFIYQGVRASGVLQIAAEMSSLASTEQKDDISAAIESTSPEGTDTALIIDIGGGSVEFILGNQDRIFWKQSFEIGGQRLLERFMPDPDVVISPTTIRRMHDYFREQLLPLHNAVHQYPPTVLVGSSGSFDTLIDMDYQHRTGQWPPTEQSAFVLPIAEFYRSYGELVTRNHAERMQLPGMIELRVDMIVVAVCLIDYVLSAFKLAQIRVSTYALKEGVLASV